jgi:hypothetical protein
MSIRPTPPAPRTCPPPAGAALRGILALGGFLLLLPAPAAAGRQPFLDGVALGSLGGADSVEAADLDGDGDLDLAVANSSSDSVFWLEDTGGAFLQHTVVTTLDEPKDLAAADIDCDGDLDLVIAAPGTGTVDWYRNDGGAGVWPLGGVISAAAGIQSVAAADLNGNGTPDVVGGGIGDELVAWTHPSCGSPTWNTTIVSSAFLVVSDVSIADTNRDGRPDVIAAVDDRIAVWENLGGGSFSRVDVDTAVSGAVGVAAGDVDGDGDLDVAGAALTGNELAWWANPGAAGAWPKTVVASLTQAAAPRLADVDGDGGLDLVAASSSGDALSWWDNAAGDGSAWTPHEIDASPGFGRALAVADLGPDGDADVVSGALVAGVLLYENASTGRSAELGPLQWLFYPYGSGPTLADLEAADMDADGVLDAVVVWEGSVATDSTVQWYRGLGASDLFGALQFDSLPHTVHQGVVHFFESVAVGDVDGDGDPDALVGAKSFPSAAYFFCRNDGAAVAWSCFDFGDAHWLVDAVALGDVDGDGDLDGVAAAQESFGGPYVVVWWENAGDPTDDADWVRHDIAPDGPFQKLVLADLDGDVDLDLVAGSVWWRNDAGAPPVWVEQTIPLLWDQTLLASSTWAVGDVDGDGDPDLMGETSTSGIAWMENDLPGGWTGAEFFAPSPDQGPSGDFTLADFDRDGDLDLLAGMLQSSPTEPRLSLFENDVATDPFAWTERPIEPTGTHLAHLRAADFDRDGDPDVVAAAGGELQGWANGGGQFALGGSGAAPDRIVEGREGPVLALELHHRGRPGEAPAELSALSLLFEESAGDPLTQQQLDDLVAAVRLYRDDGSGTLDPDLDAEVADFPAISVSDGHALLTLPDDVPELQLDPAGAPATFFVAVELTPTAGEAGVPTLTVTHTPGVPCTVCDANLPAEPSAAENADFDLPLSQEVSAPVASSFTVAPVDIFADGFESGDTSAWSWTSPP